MFEFVLGVEALFEGVIALLEDGIVGREGVDLVLEVDAEADGDDDGKDAKYDEKR